MRSAASISMCSSISANRMKTATRMQSIRSAWPGEQHLNGQQALAYSRHRKTATWGTQGRENAQTQIIEAIINKLTTVEGASNVNRVMSIAQRYISTNIPMER